MTKPGIVRECEHPGKPHKHGLDCYNYDKCRCDLGRAAERERKARYRKAKAMDAGRSCYENSVGTRRRIQALQCLGWTLHDIADAVKVPMVSIQWSLYEQRPMSRRTQARVRRVYDRLWDKTPPVMTPGRKRARTNALHRGFAPPMAWDDDTIDDPDAKPYDSVESVIDWQAIDRVVKHNAREGRPKLTRAERKAGAIALARSGASATTISRTFGLSGTDAKEIIQEVA